MPRLIFTPEALDDLVRLRHFLTSKNINAANKAKAEIVKCLKTLPLRPEAYRPVVDQPFLRDMVIEFGGYGYVARYHYKRGGDIIILRIRHQRELV
jgi:plasmid stabilization system protein ParE